MGEPKLQAPWLDTGRLVGCTAIAGLIGLLCWVAPIRRHTPDPRRRVRLTLETLALGSINLKMNADRDRSIPLAALLTGQIQAGTNQFTDPDADFQAAGVKPGDKLLILSGQSRGAREIAAIGPKALTVKAPPFTAAETGLAYLVRRADGRIWPEIDIGRELDAANPGWTGVYAPRVNKRRLRYYTAPQDKILNGQLVDPWGEPYTYTIQIAGGKIVEKIVCSGPDRKLGTPDDLEEVIAELPFGGG